MATLVIDIGQNLIGLFSVDENRYVAYRDAEIRIAIEKIESAQEVVTYNGSNYDLEELGKFAGLPAGEKLPLHGQHTDMRSICWSDRIFGKNLISTYSLHFTECPDFPNTHEGSNERDTYMTFRLWELWKQEKLKVSDGHQSV